MIAPTVFVIHQTIALVHIHMMIKYSANSLRNKPHYVSCRIPSSDIRYKCLCLAKCICFHTTCTDVSAVLQTPFFQGIEQVYQQQKHQH